LDTHTRKKAFETFVLPEIDAAYGFARWATGNPGDAQDVMQIAMARAERFIERRNGTSVRVWILSIVRHTALNWLRSRVCQNAPASARVCQIFADLSAPVGIGRGGPPSANALQPSQVNALRHAIAELPLDQREVIVLRDIESLSYREIARILEIPLDTVMSRVSRARDGLERCLRGPEGLHGA
jgi:RNA polymerase sigma-70 factor, ECF subfamily